MKRISGHRCRVKHCQLVMQSPLIREVFFFPLATSRIKWNNFQPTSSMVSSPVAIVPALISIKSNQWFASPVRVAILMTGTSIRPYGVPRPVVNTCTVIREATCCVPQTKLWLASRRKVNSRLSGVDRATALQQLRFYPI